MLLETHFDLICQKLHHLSRHSGLPEHESDELRSWALFKLVEDDYRILTSWQGRSSFPTYLNVVLVNLMRDYRTHVWGKWRPSAAARRLGQENKLHYWDNLSMAAISLLLGRSQRKLYALRDRCLRKIRRQLEKAGLSLDQVKLLLGSAHWYLDPEDI
jgi:DNA-directed RNA polymerase specialized sigma24 family protein